MKRRGWGLGIAGILVLVSAGAVWKLWRNQLGGLSLKEEIAAARREGVPLEPRDVWEPEIPPAENAAGPYLRAAAGALSTKRSGNWDKEYNLLFPPRSHRQMETLTPAERRKLRSLLAPYAPAIAQIREAGRRPTMVLNRSWSTDLVFEDIVGMRHLSQVLTVRAEARNCEGDTEGALSDLEVLARASAHLHAGKSMEEGFCRTQAEERVLDTLGQIAYRNPRHPQMPDRIRRIVRLLGPSPDLRRLISPLLWEERGMLAYFAAGGDNCTPGSPWLRLASVRNANEAYLVSYWRRIFRSIPEDPLAFDAARTAMDSVFAEYDETDTLRTKGIYLCPVGGFVDSLAAYEARRRVALTAADVVEAWQRGKKVPVPRADPFGTELRYVRYGLGVAIYSLNADRKDDGGKSLREKPGESIDIAWHLTLPTSATIAVAKR